LFPFKFFKKTLSNTYDLHAATATVKDLKRDCAAKALLVQVSFWPATNIDDEDMRITSQQTSRMMKQKARRGKAQYFW
jgi:hypothetical protein